MRTITPIAYFRSPFTSKFGIPRQSGLVEELRGRIVFEPPYRREEALKGIEEFDYLWLIWGFSANNCEGDPSNTLTVRPPRLGGNERIGVFASRSPFRPNGLGLSSVRFSRIVDGEIEVMGADLMDGTPIYDIKPYIAYADSHPKARGGFTDSKEWQELKVVIDERLKDGFSPEELQAMQKVLALDPRPHYHHDANRIYGMPFAGRDIRFRVADGVLTVTGVSGLSGNSGRSGKSGITGEIGSPGTTTSNKETT